MRIIVFDCEVFAHDWLFVFKELNGDFLCIAHNNNDEVKQLMQTEDICLCGFNNKHYDNFILSAVLNDADAETIKDINDFIMQGKNGWEHPYIKDNRSFFDSFDLIDDMLKGTSLKSIEANLGMDIEETEVDFNIDRSLTAEELALTVRYCKFDVEATERLCKLRKNYLLTKIELGRMRDIPDAVSLSCTNAKIVAKYLLAKRVEHNDGREYEYPPNLDVGIIPKTILDFFNTIHDKSIDDKTLFETSLEIELIGTPCKYAWGGVHGSKQSYFAEADDEYIIQNRDVSSLYPSLMLIYGYISRNIESFDVYKQTYDKRIAAKHSGDKKTAKTLKLPLNTCSGAAENEYNDLYDPHQSRSMRISGQLFLTDLLMKMICACPSIELLNFNTDGIMYRIKRSELPDMDAVCDEWQKRTGFELETDDILKVYIKDVNNLLFVSTDGEIKKVGSYLNYGIQEKGAWSINNNYTIVKDALENYFVNNIPLEDTINNCNDIFKFQIIAKASGKYSESYQLVNGEKVIVQRCNRVYATTNKHYGTLYKVHAETGVVSKVPNLPLHCVVDNKNQLTIEAVDKKWYINLARSYLNDYLGIPRTKKIDTRKLNSIKKKIIKYLEEKPTMAATKTAKTETATQPAVPSTDSIKQMNVWEKLLLARLDFLNSNVKKTGKHFSPNYLYFTLNDIVPVATRIFVKYRLVTPMSFEGEQAVCRVINIDKPDEVITFFSPIKTIESIESSKTGGKLTNPMQDMGSVETYSRRYLYLAVLDIAEHDDIDGENEDEVDDETIGATNVKLAQDSAPKIPLTSSERKTIVEGTTDVEGMATQIQLDALKTACAKWREVDPSCDEQIQRIAVETDGFTKVTKKICEDLLILVGNAINVIENNNGVSENV